MNGRPTEKFDIVVEKKFPADVALINLNGVQTLFLRPQTFRSAVENVRNAVAGVTLEAAEAMIREQCPEFVDIDNLLGTSLPAPPPVDRTPAPSAPDVAKRRPPRRSGVRRRQALLVAALLPALAASWALGRYTHVIDAPTAAGSPSSAPAPAGTAPGAPAAPFKDKRFQFFSDISSIDCNPVSTLAAECTDADGMVMSTKAATGPDSTVFTFSYGSEGIGLRVFYDEEYARTWARQDGSREMYPNLRQDGRYVLWGTDKERIGEYTKLLQEADRGGHSDASRARDRKPFAAPPHPI
ncbi:hypothetical protein HHL19_35225 [Streptomyces sp. R302]|uniref:hypothetical protein n=1 Tax=unclassified Streptomyces TaxID=2593676 RepID=UPI00145C9497|nr:MULTISPECIES: hypothetical protein [unclassified Streptomyces]NML55205.1 hypothetical protein [Streptomyces sp. R301]NML83765.1 hypothetical protein [Streptomyces sp. R302]